MNIIYDMVYQRAKVRCEGQKLDNNRIKEIWFEELDSIIEQFEKEGLTETAATCRKIASDQKRLLGITNENN